MASGKHLKQKETGETMKAGQPHERNESPKASVRYFENRNCEYYPCHTTEGPGFNCLFCFCPMYFALCPGTPRYIEKNRILFKSCADCEYPHRPENYDTIMDFLAAMLRAE